MNKEFDTLEDMYFEKDGERINIMDIKPDPKILNMAREYDKMRAKKKRIQQRKRFMQIAAMIMICFVSLSAITLETSDAFRARFYQIFSSEDEGSAALLSQDEYDLIGEWKDYWYPTYLPEGFVLEAAEKTELEKVMLFALDAETECRIREIQLEATTTIDIDYTLIEEVKIGYYNGCILINQDYNSSSIYWTTEDRQICIEMTNGCDKEMLLEIAENMKYRER